MSTSTSTLIPEWHPSEAVLLAWPDEHTDWAPWLAAARKTYVELIHAIDQCDAVTVLLCRPEQVNTATALIPEHLKVLIVAADYNDTWVRDYGFLTVNTSEGPAPIEFTFNGWGNKFNAGKDNAVNTQTLAKLCRLPLTSVPIVAEGGALEINDQGHLLSTVSCLANPQRNGAMAMDEYRRIFGETLGATQTTILQHGHLQGDDTDGHIDTLVRFTPSGGLVIQGCVDESDTAHYEPLNKLVAECQSTFPDSALTVLPLCQLYNQDGDRLPASYANYLVCNQSVLVPTYGVDEDAQALALIAAAYPDHRVQGIDCAPLIQQFGSLHCISMQVPVNTIQPSILSLAQHGVHYYAS